MTRNEKQAYWIIWVAFLLIAVGQIVYNIVFNNVVNSDIFLQYDIIDAKLPTSAKLSKYFFGVCESLSFVIIIFVVRGLAIKDLGLRVAYGLFFILTCANFCNALFGIYYSLLGLKYTFGYVVSTSTLALIEYLRLRGKHT